MTLRRPPDLALIRFLRAGARDDGVLNRAAPFSPTDHGDPDIAAALLIAARAVAPDADAGVPYARIATSPAFVRYRKLAARLRGFDPASLSGWAERTAFWINVYNALVIDAVVSLGIHDTIREAPGFFHRAAYQIGPFRFDLEAIEHGLLRGNRPPLPRMEPPFIPGDPRLSLGPGRFDPRIHFALNCGTRSCPPIAFYDAPRLDQQLDAAAASFITGGGVCDIDGELVLSPLFDFYQEDFGGRDGVRALLLRYLDDLHLRARVTADEGRAGAYDWTLNRKPDEVVSP